MFDDGGHGDGVASDGLYGAVLALQPAARSLNSTSRRPTAPGSRGHGPAPAWKPNNTTPVPNALYQVDTEQCNTMPAVG